MTDSGKKCDTSEKQSVIKRLKILLGGAGSERRESSGRINKAVVLVCAAAIVILFGIRIFGGSADQAEDKGRSAIDNETVVTADDHADRMERDLAEILEKIQGAGNVSVRIYIDSTGEKVLAEDSKQESETRESGGSGSDSGVSGEKTVSDSNERSTVIASGTGSFGGSGSPYVIREKLPYPIGVIVVAEGARNERVRNEIYEAVKALYGLSANRIKITY